ncbi:hypothetical protein AXG93_1939s1010 [Marchantia polymorpha subsp. ruderalis]|uniref:Uncharacterized protein n=1 Tax=Marchantia polymorpha subsp. ruderalis TaxID=1480154 RepID=A0A176VW62_MARPO|nr:hypothetical protein AXG93_1939s1010 [Marchantia polymorpha subsp. ruderalis]
MDSADEEPELPSAIQDLVRRLEGQGWQKQVRLRVLEAIGRCSTLEIVDVNYICGGDILMLTASEWELVLGGFRSSTVLQKIIVEGLFFVVTMVRVDVPPLVHVGMGSKNGAIVRVDVPPLVHVGTGSENGAIVRVDVPPLVHVGTGSENGAIVRVDVPPLVHVATGSENGTIVRVEVPPLVHVATGSENGARDRRAELESLCLQLGRILNSSTVTELIVYNVGLCTRCFQNLASGVNCESKLQSLELELEAVREGSSKVKHVAHMITSAPLLKTLSLHGNYEDMQDEAVGILSQALIQSSSLKELVLDRVNLGGLLLLKVLAGDDRNGSIERLRLFETVGLGGCLSEILISSPSLNEVDLYRLWMSREEWHQLGEVIRDNAIATTILVKFDFHYNDWKSLEAPARYASSYVKDPPVKLEVHTREPGLDFLLRIEVTHTR